MLDKINKHKKLNDVNIFAAGDCWTYYPSNCNHHIPSSWAGHPGAVQAAAGAHQHRDVQERVR